MKNWQIIWLGLVAVMVLSVAMNDWMRSRKMKRDFEEVLKNLNER